MQFFFSSPLNAKVMGEDVGPINSLIKFAYNNFSTRVLIPVSLYVKLYDVSGKLHNLKSKELLEFYH